MSSNETASLYWYTDVAFDTVDVCSLFGDQRSERATAMTKSDEVQCNIGDLPRANSMNDIDDKDASRAWSNRFAMGRTMRKVDSRAWTN